MYSVVILTLNEEHRLPACLASVADCDDVVVLDSGSTDRTVAIAEAAGARVSVNRFENFAQQRNHAHEAVPFRHPWVFHLDADEQFTPELHAECANWPGDSPFDGAWAAPRMLWEGCWLPRCTDYPAWQARFVRPATFRFIEVGHGQREAPTMRMTRLQSNYRHDMSAGGTAAWLDKHRRYARAEAAAEAATQPPAWHELFTGNALLRRRALKRLSFRLPARGFLRLVYQYGLRGGFLDGGPAWTYCRLLARYESMVAAELRALRRGPAPA